MIELTQRTPLNQRTVDVVVAAIDAAGACPVPVLWRGTVPEIAVFAIGQWLGSVIRAPQGGFLGLDENGMQLTATASAEQAVQSILDLAALPSKSRRTKATSKSRRRSPAALISSPVVDSHPRAQEPVAPPAPAESRSLPWPETGSASEADVSE